MSSHQGGDPVSVVDTVTICRRQPILDQGLLDRRGCC